MRVCMLGHFQSPAIEGARKTFAEISERLSIRAEVEKYDVSRFGRVYDARRFSPDILHAVIGPSSLLSLVTLRTWACLSKAKVVILSAVQFTIEGGRLPRVLLRPDLTLVQSEESRMKGIASGWKTMFLPSGVDTRKYVPIDLVSKKKIREDMGLPTEERILLHVGPVKRERNMLWLRDITTKGNLLLVVSRPNDRGDPSLISDLRRNGSVILTDFQPHMERVYQSADALVFPVTDIRSCMETPLSVLEACACNLPIVSTRFGSLPSILSGVPGIKFVRDLEEFKKEISMLKKDDQPIMTRKAVLPYDWDVISSDIFNVYESLLEQRKRVRGNG